MDWIAVAYDDVTTYLLVVLAQLSYPLLGQPDHDLRGAPIVSLEIVISLKWAVVAEAFTHLTYPDVVAQQDYWSLKWAA
jgi:hypothetical protein